ncbi:MAG: regulatory protein RecX, partial [bacterium]
RYARRRRLGQFRLDPDVREERRQRDLAALGRSGFSYGIASRIIEAECVETLESRVTEQD